MNGLPYVYTPRPGETVKVDRHGGGTDDAHLLVCGQAAGSVRISREEVPEVAAGISAAMHEAAGLPAPVILERPGVLRAGLIPGVDFRVRHGGVEVIQLSQAADSARLFQPGEIRVFVASLAILADEARDGPDPDEVGELAAALRGHGGGLTTTRVDDIARAALRWMRDKQQRGESRDG